MTTTPTAEQFLLSREFVEDDEDAFEHPDPLESIADSLRRIAAGMGGETFEEVVAEQETPDDRLQQAFDDLEDKHRSLFELLAQVEKIVKPSTSKVSLEVKDAIAKWKNPEVPKALTAEEVAAAQQESVPGARSHPAHDAAVEEWREYARWLGVLPEEPDAIDSMNRSQIRTMLGIEQPASS